MMNSVINLKWHARKHPHSGKVSILANTIKKRHLERGSLFLSGETTLQPHKKKPKKRNNKNFISNF